MDWFTLVLIALLVVLVSVWLSAKKGRRKSLPGPTGLPIVGFLPFMTSKPYVKLTEISKKYGPIYSIRLGGTSVVVITDFKLTKEAFASDAFLGRPPDIPFELSETTKKTGAVLDLPWKDQRRFSLNMLKDLGFGKTKTEEHIKEEVLELLERMAQLEGLPTKMSDILAPSMSNNIASFLFGRRLKHNDPKRVKLDQMLGEAGRLAGATTWQMFFPWINAISKKLKIGDKKKLLHALQELKNYVEEEVVAHESSLDVNNVRDFLDGYLLEIRKKANDPTSSFKRDVLIDLARGFFSAGSETVRISLDWLLLICAANPQVQRRIYSEIIDVVGSDRFPNRSDHVNMPYTEAVILEQNRWRTVVPINLMRYTLEDAELGGYFIPKHSRVLSIIWAVHHSKELWGHDAEEFRPERFLSADGTQILKPEYYIPFSTGKRQCPGEAFAKMEVFNYVVAILQRFEVSLPPGETADFDGQLGIGLQPKRQEIVFKRR